MTSNIITKIKQALPKVELQENINFQDFYGFSNYISKKLKLDFIPTCDIEMPHGIHELNARYSEELIYSKKINKYEKIIVAQPSSKKILRKDGYKNVSSIGYPYIYIKKNKKIKRYKDTLLVLPPASFGNSQESVIREEDYIKEINNIRKDFKEVVFCIKSDCLEKNLWVNNLKKYNYNWIKGASIYDKNALERMHVIFNSFEYMTTNNIGSHIFYAMYSGMKVSFYGRFFSYSREKLRKHYYNQSDKTFKNQIKKQSIKKIKQEFDYLFYNHPKSAIKRRDVGKKYLYDKKRISFKNLANKLGWFSLSNSHIKPNEELKFSKHFSLISQQIKKLDEESKKVVIYGKGSIGKYIKSLLLKSTYEFIETINIETIKDIQYDYLIISLLGREDEILNNLNKITNIDKSKIITFYMR